MNGSTTNGSPDGCRGPTSGLTLLDVVIIVVIVAIIAAFLFPVFGRTHCGGVESSCQNNMKELGTALNMYHGDYNSRLPSSFLYGRSETWNVSDFTHFATERGGLPPKKGQSRGSTWVTLLYPYMKINRIFMCARDPANDDPKNRTVSYFYKAAMDRAWYDAKAQKEADFEFPADQVVFYEHNDWHHDRHWWESDKGLSNGVSLNMTFLDGHVSTKRVKDSSGPAVTPAPAAGEPAWYNYDGKHEKAVGVGQYFDPRVYCDSLP